MKLPLSFISMLLSILIMLSSSLQAQKRQNWRWQNPNPQGNTLRGSDSPNPDIVVMVGDAGTILKSKDGGLTFSRQQTNTRKDLYAVSFFDVNNGMAVGEGGIIIKTTDCGQTWNKLNSGRNDTLRGISMLSRKVIIAVGDTGTIIKSIDGGSTWTYIPFPGLSSNLNDIYFPVGGSGFGSIIGDSMGGFGGPPIIISGDSGISFSQFGTGFPLLENRSFNSVWSPASDSNKIIAVGDKGTIVSTTDKGATISTPISPVNVDIKDVWFFTDNDGFATGPGGTLLRTKDCGDTWSLVITPLQRDLLTVSFPKDSTGYFGGGQGLIITSPDGGASFSPVQTGFFPDLTSIAFLDDSFGIATHQYGVAVGGFGSVLRTEDGGGLWEQVPPVTTDPIEAVTRPRKTEFGNKLWMAGGQFGGFGRIWFSEDSAQTWKPQVIFSQFKFFDITFCDSLNGFVVGLGGVIFCTKDGGMTWNQKTSGSSNWLLGADMPSDSCAYVVGGFGTILKTTDAGNTWNQQVSGTNEWLTDVSFLDDSFGIATGNHGVVLRTINAGNTWVLISPPNLQSDLVECAIHTRLGFRRSSGGIKTEDVMITAVGNDGVIVYSPDGGDTWYEQNSLTKHHLRACFFSDSTTGTAVGTYGTILFTDSLRTTTVSLEESPIEDWMANSPLGLNYPNPVSLSTRIPFSIPYTAPVDLRIFDLQGKEVDRLIYEGLTPGTYEYDWKPDQLTNGIYVYRLQIGHLSYSRKLVISR